MFKCSFCGKEYENALDRAKCEIECDKANKAKAEVEKQEKLKAEQKARAEETKKAYAEYVETCNNAREKYLEILHKYQKDYPKAVSSARNIKSDLWLEQLLNEILY